MGDIKTRFTLEGEQTFKKAMSDAAAATKVLNSEQKLAKAQFKNTGDAEKYAAQQSDILKRKIEQQKNAVKAAEQAMKQLADNGVAKNSRIYQQWQTRLNNAQTALTDMETELRNVSQTMQQTTGTAEETGNALSAIGTKVSLDGVIGGIGKITGALEAAAGKAVELGQKLISTMKDSAHWADEIATMSTVYGIDPQQMQRMVYTANIIDTTAEDIFRSRQKLINNMYYGSDDVLKTFKELGVATHEWRADSSGKLDWFTRDWEDVFWEAGQALMGMDFEEASAKATKIFGRSWEKLKPLFGSDWASEDNYLGKAFGSAREYYDAVMESWNTVSEENLNNLTKYDDALQRMEAEFNTLKQTATGTLAPAFTEVTNTISTLLGEFNKYLETDEGKAKMQDLSDAVTNLFSGLTNVDFGTALDTATKAIDSLTKGLNWISDHWTEVDAGIRGLAAAFGILKVSEGVLTFVQLIASGKFLFGGGGNGGSGGSGTGTGSFLAGLGTKIASGVAKAAPVVPYLFPLALGIDGFVRGQKMLSEAAAAGEQSQQEYREKRARYKDERMFVTWDQLARAATPSSGMPELNNRLKFAQDYMAWFNSDETSNPNSTFYQLTENLKDYDAFHDMMERIAAGEMFNSSADQDALLSVFQDAQETMESLMEQNPLQLTPDLAGLQETLNANPVAMPVVLMPTSNRYGWDPSAAKGNSFSSNLYVENMNVGGGVDADGLAARMAAQQRRTMKAYGNGP